MDSQWKKAVGVLKDVASMGFAKLNNPLGFIDVAVVKATQHNCSPPNEKHVLAALSATNSARSRSRLKHAIEERLWRTKDWMVAVKTLALIHRLMRDSIFIEEEEMQRSSHATVLAITSLQFHDGSSPLASDCSLWVRKYSAYLDQRLRCSRIFKTNILSECLHQRTTDLDVNYIFISLPSLQQLMGCLLNCTPQGSHVVVNPLIQYALDLLVKESRNIYGTINHFIHKLVDSFMAGMAKYKVIRLINICKRFYEHCDRLSEFYDNCGMVSQCNNIDLPPVVKPSESILAKMENYLIKCADQPPAKELTAKADETGPRTGDKEVSQLVLPALPAVSTDPPAKGLTAKADETGPNTGDKEGSQLAVPSVPAVSTGEAIEDKLLITWWDADDNVPPPVTSNSNTLIDIGTANKFGSSNNTAAEAHEHNAHIDWHIALDCPIMNPSTRYQPIDMGKRRNGRDGDFGVAHTLRSSKDTSKESHQLNVQNDWGRALDSSIINPSARYRPANMERCRNGRDLDALMCGYGVQTSATDLLPSMLQLPSIQMEHNTQLQVQETAIDDQLHQMASSQCYLLPNNSNAIMDFGAANTLGPSKDSAEDAHNELNAHNDWEMALDCSILDPSSSYQTDSVLECNTQLRMQEADMSDQRQKTGTAQFYPPKNPFEEF